MADERKITITILDSGSLGVDSDGDGSSEKKDNSIEKHLNDTLKKMKSSVKETESSSTAKSVLINQTFQLAKNSFFKALTFSLRRTNTLTEDYIGEMYLQHIQTALGKGVGLVTTAASGAIAGAKVGGVYGGIAGAVIGIVGWGVGEYVSGQETKSGIYQNLNATIFQTEFMASRAGLVNNSRGTEN